MAALSTTLLVGLIVGGAATSAVGQKKAGTAAKKAGAMTGDLMDYNAQIADLQAADALERGALSEEHYREMVRGVIGQQRAGFAAQGVDVASGSALDVQADAAQLGELDALQIRQNAMREAWGYKVQAYDLRARGEIARKTGQAQASAANWGAAGTLIGAGGNLMLMRYGYNQNKPAA